MDNLDDWLDREAGLAALQGVCEGVSSTCDDPKAYSDGVLGRGPAPLLLANISRASLATHCCSAAILHDDASRPAAMDQCQPGFCFQRGPGSGLRPLSCTDIGGLS